MAILVLTTDLPEMTPLSILTTYRRFVTAGNYPGCEPSSCYAQLTARDHRVIFIYSLTAPKSTSVINLGGVPGENKLFMFKNNNDLV